MNKIEIIVAIALGQISVLLAMLKKLPQNDKTRKWIVGLKIASGALSEIVAEPDQNSTVL